SDKGLSKLVDEAEYILGFPKSVLGPAPTETVQGWLTEFRTREEVVVLRDVKGLKRKIDVKAGVEGMTLGGEAELETLRRAGVVGDLVPVRLRVPLSQSGAVRSREVAEALTGSIETPFIAVRTGLFARNSALLDLSIHRVPSQTDG